MSSISVHRLLRKVLVLALVSFPVALPQGASVVSANPLDGIPSTYKDYENFRKCSNSVTTFCIESFTIDLDGDGTFEEPAQNSGITFEAWIFSIKDWNTPSLDYRITVNSNRELSPTIPVGTASKFAINTGAFKPSPSMLAMAEVIDLDLNQVAGNWITSGTWKTTSHTDGDRGNDSGGRIHYNKNLRDYVSIASGVHFYEEPNTLTASKRGMWVASNAGMIEELRFNTATMTWNIRIAGPSRKQNGAANILTYKTFLPDTFIQFAYGTTADVLSGALAMTRTDGGTTRSVNATITRVTNPIPGLIVSFPDIKVFGTIISEKSVQSSSIRPSARFSANPTLRISPKRALLRAPSLQQTNRTSATSIRVVGSSVSGARGYQAMCNQGLDVRLVNSKSPRIRVSELSEGRWTCKIRARGTLAGKWSKTKKVTLP